MLKEQALSILLRKITPGAELDEYTWQPDDDDIVALGTCVARSLPVRFPDVLHEEHVPPRDIATITKMFPEDVGIVVEEGKVLVNVSVLLGDLSPGERLQFRIWFFISSTGLFGEDYAEERLEALAHAHLDTAYVADVIDTVHPDALLYELISVGAIIKVYSDPEDLYPWTLFVSNDKKLEEWVLHNFPWDDYGIGADRDEVVEDVAWAISEIMKIDDARGGK